MIESLIALYTIISTLYVLIGILTLAKLLKVIPTEKDDSLFINTTVFISCILTWPIVWIIVVFTTDWEQ